MGCNYSSMPWLQMAVWPKPPFKWKHWWYAHPIQFILDEINHPCPELNACVVQFSRQEKETPRFLKRVWKLVLYTVLYILVYLGISRAVQISEKTFHHKTPPSFNDVRFIFRIAPSLRVLKTASEAPVKYHNNLQHQQWPQSRHFDNSLVSVYCPNRSHC